MKKFFKSRNRTVYIGDSEQKYRMISKVLGQNNISCKTSTVNHNTSFMGPGSGVPRSVSGIDSINKGVIYEIQVAEEDYEKAMALIRDAQN